MNRAPVRGINLGGWLSQSALSSQHVTSFLELADIELISTWQFRHVRVPVASHLLWDYELSSLRDDGVHALDQVVEWCARTGLQCVIALHVSLVDRAEKDHISRLGPGKECQQLSRLWMILAERYAAESDSLLFYDLIHRPVMMSAISWNDTARAITEAIRTVDSRHTLIVSGPQAGHPNGFVSLRPTGDSNTIYACHFFEPPLFTHQQLMISEHVNSYCDTVPYPGQAPPPKVYPEGRAGERMRAEVGRRWDRTALADALDPVLAFQEIYDLPIWVASFGGSCRAARRCQRTWLRSVLTLFKQSGLAWSYWTYRGLGFGLLDPWDELSGTVAKQPEGCLDYDRLALLQTA